MIMQFVEMACNQQGILENRAGPYQHCSVDVPPKELPTSLLVPTIMSGLLENEQTNDSHYSNEYVRQKV